MSNKSVEYYYTKKNWRQCVHTANNDSIYEGNSLEEEFYGVGSPEERGIAGVVGNDQIVGEKDVGRVRLLAHNVFVLVNNNRHPDNFFYFPEGKVTVSGVEKENALDEVGEKGNDVHQAEKATKFGWEIGVLSQCLAISRQPSSHEERQTLRPLRAHLQILRMHILSRLPLCRECHSVRDRQTFQIPRPMSWLLYL